VELRLPNGLLVLIETSSSASRLEVTTGYFAGYRDEPDSARGLAHLLEHMAMRETREGLSLAAAFAEKGVDAAALTQGDVTIFTEAGSASTATLETILRLERLRMTDLALAGKAIDIEKRRVAVEVGSREPDQPWRRSLFGTHRLGRISSHADLDRIDLAAVRRFYSTYYTPANCAIVIASPGLAVVDVRRLVEQVFASVPKGPALPRPALRDTTPLMPRWWTGTSSNSDADGILAAVSVPGLQHADRIALERDITAIANRLAESGAAVGGRGVSIDVTDEAPAAVLRVRSSKTDPALAQTDLDDFLALLSAAMDRTTAPRRAGGAVQAQARTPPYWLDCESAGDWRYCLDIGDARKTPPADAAPATLDRYLRAARTNSNAATPDATVALWPSPARSPVAASAAAVSAPNVSAAPWMPPELGDLRWSETARGLQWAAVRGGTADSVFIGAWLTLPPQSAALGDISAIELWARTWATLRLPSGEQFQSAAGARGASVRVRSLPYPPLATTDKFRMLGVLPTPLGVAGVEVVAAAPRHAAGEVVRLLGDALKNGVPDEAAVSAERDRQLQMLRAAIVAAPYQAEIAFRRSVPVLAADAGPTSRPAPLAEQITSMERTTPSDVQTIANRLGLEGTARVVILGASPKDAEAWITATPWSTLKGVRRKPASSGCPSLAPGDVRIPGAQSNAVVYLALCVPMGAPSAVPATALLVNALLGGREDALLAARLRMETGLAYSFESRVISDIDGHATLWYLNFSTAAGKVDQGIAEVRAVLEKAATGGIPADRMASFREWLAQQRVDRARDGFAWVMSLLSSGLAPEQEAAAIRATTDAEVNALLRAWWLSSRLTITATMPASRR
jgi:predicted Zn-dependent peptidase